jgi:hypothetical protein
MKTKTKVAVQDNPASFAVVGDNAALEQASLQAVALSIAGRPDLARVEVVDASVKATPKPKRITQNRLDLFLDAKSLVKEEAKDLKAALDSGAEVEEGVCDAVIEVVTEREINFRDLAVELADLLVAAGVIEKVEDGEAYVKGRVQDAPLKPARRLKVWRDE